MPSAAVRENFIITVHGNVRARNRTTLGFIENSSLPMLSQNNETISLVYPPDNLNETPVCVFRIYEMLVT